MRKAAEKLIEDGENDGISGQPEETGSKIVAGAEAVDPVVQQIAAELEIVPGIVVDCARRPDEVEAEDEPERDPERPAARPAGRMGRWGHAWRRIPQNSGAGGVGKSAIAGIVLRAISAKFANLSLLDSLSFIVE